jgi:hypothetical protein
MVKQLLLPSSSELGLGNLLIFLPRNKQNLGGKRIKKIWLKEELKSQMRRNIFSQRERQRYYK